MIDLKTARLSTLIATGLFLIACGTQFKSMDAESGQGSAVTRAPGFILPPGPLPTPAPTTLTGFPNAENTGIPSGTVLKSSGAITVTTAGTVIDSMDIKGTLTIMANNVTIKRSKITVAGFVVVRVLSDLTNVVIQDCEINGVGTGNDGMVGIQGPGIFLRNNISNVEIGISPDSAALIQDNYIHDLKASGSPQYNGILIEGGVSNILIHHNSILNLNAQTSAVMIDNFFGAVNNITVDGNLLAGGTYTIYSDGSNPGGAISGVSIIDNHIRTGKLGYTQVKNNSPLFSGNVDDATLVSVP